MNIHVLCVSKGRQTKVMTKRLFPNLKLVVPHNEEDSYREANPDVEVIGTPKSVNSLVKTRQWMLENFGTQFMVDDDITDCKRMYADSNDTASIDDPETGHADCRNERLDGTSHWRKDVGVSGRPTSSRVHQSKAISVHVVLEQFVHGLFGRPRFGVPNGHGGSRRSLHQLPERLQEQVHVCGSAIHVLDQRQLSF